MHKDSHINNNKKKKERKNEKKKMKNEKLFRMTNSVYLMQILQLVSTMCREWSTSMQM